MKKGYIHNLTRGINLEKSQVLIPWKTSFSDLKAFGKPESRCLTGREMMVWKNEQILNGIPVDLNVTLETGTESEGSRLKHVCAYISESDFKKARTQLSAELKQKGKYEKLNDVEYSYTWKVNGCNVVLSHVERFGSYWKLEIAHEGSMLDQLKRRRFRGFSFTTWKNILNRHRLILSMDAFEAEMVVIG